MEPQAEGASTRLTAHRNACGSRAQRARDRTTSEDTVMEELELRVDGMSCGVCEQRIQRALAQVEGVVRSAADRRAAQVKVVFDPARTSTQAVRGRIEQAGYEVKP